MRHMVNIFLLTVLALVIIAALVELCRQKDHGTKEIPFTRGIVRFTDRGIVTDWEMSPLMTAYYKDLEERTGLKSAALQVEIVGNSTFVKQQLEDRQTITKFNNKQFDDYQF